MLASAQECSATLVVSHSRTARAAGGVLVEDLNVSLGDTVERLRGELQRTRAQAAATIAASIEARKLRIEASVRVSDPELPGPADAPGAIFRDSTGRPWRVREVLPPASTWTQGESCLLFESADVIRRVWRYPGNWFRLPDVELEALSWQR